MWPLVGNSVMMAKMKAVLYIIYVVFVNDTGRTTETADRWLEELTRLIAGDYEGAVDEGLLVIGRSSACQYRFRVGKSGFAICLRHIEGPEVTFTSRWNIQHYKFSLVFFDNQPFQKSDHEANNYPFTDDSFGNRN